MKAWILGMALPVMSLSAVAAQEQDDRWVKMTHSNDGLTNFYVDTHTIKRTGDVVNVWVKSEGGASKSKAQGKVVHHTLLLSRFDCAGRTVAVLNSIDYGDAAGDKIVGSQEAPESSIPVPPGSTGEAMLTWVCEATVTYFRCPN